MDVVSPLPSQTCQSSANSSQISYIPQVKNNVIPKINQEFVNLDAVHKFYNNYGKESGFGTQEHSSRKNGDKKVVKKEYVCCKQGHSVPKKSAENSGSSKRRRGIIREGCGAKLSVVRSKSGDKYVVSQFVEAHNHLLTSPGRTHLLRSHRKVTAAKRALVQQLSQANVPTCQQMSIFKVQSGGLENVGFELLDLYNTERDIRTELLRQDADMLHEYFQIQQQKNSGFMFIMEKDDEMRMQILDLPDELILVRWTKLAKIKTVANDLGGSVQEICDASVFERRKKLFKLASSVIDDAVSTEGGSELLEEALCSVQNKLCAMNIGTEGGKLSASASQVSIPCEHIFKESLQVWAKGCGKRLEGGKEKAVKKSRRCNGYGLTGHMT
ncbi:hypothetical protein RHSIM_Rhsim09G0080800 [Rhododendron simsii]|uniref:FAR1 domain-containing protein n=1 Tax=Rhododendron simsii TaxID=118357 RepID=A0A834GEY1_RHOSS|nr:hypothetical protein RHSIM_Rhsim09G0080800 [Rhododendron simsii]